LAVLRDTAPAVHLERYDVWAVARHDDVTAALRDHETFGSNRGVGLTDLSSETAWRKPSILVEADPPEHTVNRKVVAGTMTPKALRSLQDVLDRAAADLVDDLVERGRFDGVTDLAEVFPTEVFPKAFGLEVSDETRARLLAYGSMVFNGNGPDNELFRNAMVDAAETVKWVGNQCRREALRAGGIGAAIHDAAAEAGLDEEAAGMLVRSFLSAGVDTTVSGIAFAVRATLERTETPGAGTTQIASSSDAESADISVGGPASTCVWGW
jgi:cytochrome P450